MLILTWKQPLIKTRIYHGPSINRMQTAATRLYNIPRRRRRRASSRDKFKIRRRLFFFYVGSHLLVSLIEDGNSRDARPPNSEIAINAGNRAIVTHVYKWRIFKYFRDTEASLSVCSFRKLCPLIFWDRSVSI